MLQLSILALNFCQPLGYESADLSIEKFQVVDNAKGIKIAPNIETKQN